MNKRPLIIFVFFALTMLTYYLVSPDITQKLNVYSIFLVVFWPVVFLVYIVWSYAASIKTDTGDRTTLVWKALAEATSFINALMVMLLLIAFFSMGLLSGLGGGDNTAISVTGISIPVYLIVAIIQENLKRAGKHKKAFMVGIWFVFVAVLYLFWKFFS